MHFNTLIVLSIVIEKILCQDKVIRITRRQNLVSPRLLLMGIYHDHIIMRTEIYPQLKCVSETLHLGYIHLAFSTAAATNHRVLGSRPFLNTIDEALTPNGQCVQN